MRGVTALFGPSGCGKTTVLALRRRAAEAAGRRPLGRRRDLAGGRCLPAALRARGRLRVPGGEPVPASLGAAQSALRPPAGAAPRHARGDPLRRGGGAARDRAAAGAGAAPPLGRRAPAGRGRPRAALATAAAADGRAARRPRPLQQGRDLAVPRGAARDARDPDPLCQPRPRRGRAAGRPSAADGRRPRARLRAAPGAAGRSRRCRSRACPTRRSRSRPRSRATTRTTASRRLRSTAARSSCRATTARRARCGACACAPPT